MSWFRRDDKEAPSAVHGTLEIGKPWARSSSRKPDEAGGFLSIANKGPAADRLTAASSPLAETVEIHGIKVVGAGIQMRPRPDGVVVDAGGIATLKPRGYHLLLRGVKVPLAKGSRLPVTLSFEKAGAITVEFDVEEPGPVGEAVLDEDVHGG